MLVIILSSNQILTHHLRVAFLKRSILNVYHLFQWICFKPQEDVILDYDGHMLAFLFQQHFLHLVPYEEFYSQGSSLMTHLSFYSFTSGADLYILGFIADVPVIITNTFPKLCPLQFNQFLRPRTEFLVILPLKHKASITVSKHHSKGMCQVNIINIEILENLFGKVSLENIAVITHVFLLCETEQK